MPANLGKDGAVADMKLGGGLALFALAVQLTACGPKAPDQALQISGSVQGQAISGFVLPATGQVTVMLGDRICQGVLSDFKDDPRTGLLLCGDARGGVAYSLTASMESMDAGHLVLRQHGGRRSFTADISSQFDTPRAPAPTR